MEETEAKRHTWNTVRLETVNDTLSRRVISGQHLMVAQVFLLKGAIVPEHRHENEQMTCVLEGALEFTIGGKTTVAAKGDVMQIPPHVPHAAVALDDTFTLELFSPPRQDWLTGSDAYLRK